MASFTPLESGTDIRTAATRMRGRGHRETPGIIIDRTCRVYITRIPTLCIERDGVNALRKEFEAFGPVESYKMFTERSGRFIGSALCTFRSPADAAAAVKAMNNREIEDSVLKVTVARDHGVVLLHPSQRKTFIRGGEDGEAAEAESSNDINSRWKHDKYELLAQGKDMEEVLGEAPSRRGGYGGRGGGGRGRGGWGADRVEEAFERYIAERDRDLNVMNVIANPDGHAEPATDHVDQSVGDNAAQ